MSFWKAEQLLELATFAAARHAGVSLDEVTERFSVSKRTAQRMLRALARVISDLIAAVRLQARWATGVRFRRGRLSPHNRRIFCSCENGQRG